MLNPRSWLAAAQALPEGGRGRVNHDCGGGSTLLITHERDHWGAFCFRCDDHGYQAKPAESWQARLARLTRERKEDADVEQSLSQPCPANYDVVTWPAPARVWLYKAGLGIPEIADIGAYFHPATGRVVLPVFDGDTLIYWQARDPEWYRGKHRPKYINPTADKQRLVARYGRGDPLVLTEDVLSAYRVGQVTEAWSLLGTSLSTHVATRIPESRPVCVWLDPDRPGVRAARRITNELTAQGISAHRIVSRADPKCLSKGEIHELLRATHAA